MEKQHDCKECANMATPICERCVYITRPDGSLTKPTRFLPTVPVEAVLEMDMTEEEKKEAGVRADQDAALTIFAYIIEKKPIPLRYVMRYNELTAAEEGGNGETEAIQI